MQIPYQSLLHSVGLILKDSTIQFIFLFGSFFVAGLILTVISRWTQNIFQQFRFPNFGLYFFGVIGVPIHELCHAVFAKVFLHEIKKIKWFDPTGKSGSYGCVTHYYDEKNFYHRLGLFFIGMGPVLLAPLFLFAAFHWLVPGSVHMQIAQLKSMTSLRSFGVTLLAGQNWRSIGFYVFLYLTVCITSQMELSSEDLKIARQGIFPFFALIFVLNLVAHLFGFSLHGTFQELFHSVFLFWISFSGIAVIVAIINLLLCLILMSLLNKLMGAELINPFRD